MRKHGGTPSRRDKHVTLAAISPPGVTRGRFVGSQQSGLAGSKPPPLFTRRPSSCSSQGRRQEEPWGACPRPSAPTYLPGIAGASGAVFTSVSSFLVSIFVRPSCLYMTDLGALDVRHGVAAGTQRQSASACVCCASLAACCWCRVSCCLFLMRKMFYLLNYDQSRITQARDKQVEENQDQSVKGCSVNSKRC